MLSRDTGIGLMLWAIVFALVSRPELAERIRQVVQEAFKIFIR